MLKRVRATPLPAWAYFLGLLAHCIVVSVVDVALIVGVGHLFGVPLPTQWAAIGAALVLGAASFCALGVAVASLIRNAEAAPAVVQLVLFPLVFISGTYLPIHSALLNRISGWLPVRPFNQALLGPVRAARRGRLEGPGGAPGLGRGRGAGRNLAVPLGSPGRVSGQRPLGKLIETGATSGFPTCSWIWACFSSGMSRGLPR